MQGRLPEADSSMRHALHPAHGGVITNDAREDCPSQHSLSSWEANKMSQERLRCLKSRRTAPLESILAAATSTRNATTAVMQHAEGVTWKSLQGRSATGSLKYALACGAVVLWPRDSDDSREEFFHPMLKVFSLCHKMCLSSAKNISVASSQGHLAPGVSPVLKVSTLPF